MAIACALVAACAAEPTKCLELSPTELDFGEVESSPTQSAARSRVSVINHSGQAMTLQLSELDPPFFIAGRGEHLDAGETEFLDVAFKPTDARSSVAELELTAGDCTATLPLRGRGTGVFVMDPQRLDFGLVPLGQARTLEVVLFNSRRTPVRISGLRILPADSIFSIDAPADFEVPIGVSTIKVSALATTAGSYRAHLRGTDSVGLVEFEIRIDLEAGDPLADVTPAHLDVPVAGLYPDAGPAQPVLRYFTLENLGDAVLRLVDPFVTVESPDGGASTELTAEMPSIGLRPAASLRVALRFRPTFPAGPRDYLVKVHTNSSARPTVTFRFTSVVEELPPCTLRTNLQDDSLARIELSSEGDGGLRGQLDFENVGDERCLVELMPYAPFLAEAPALLEIPPLQTVPVQVTGPDFFRRGEVGTFGFQVHTFQNSISLVPLVVP